jgi:hypothetical protein
VAISREVFPVCPLERSHDIRMTNQDCWACGLIQGLWAIATETTDSGDPATEAQITLDDNIEYA